MRQEEGWLHRLGLFDMRRTGDGAAVGEGPGHPGFHPRLKG